MGKARPAFFSWPGLALAWCLKNNNVSTVIMGASNINQLKENLRSLDVVEKLDSEVMQQIEMVLDNKIEYPVY